METRIDNKITFTKSIEVDHVTSSISAQVKQIEFEECSAQDKVWAQIITALSNLQNLQKVIFSGCGIGRTDIDFDDEGHDYQNQQFTQTKAELTVSKLRQIRSLALRNCRLGPHTLKIVNELTDLIELELCSNRLGKSIRDLNLPNLKKLCIKHCEIYQQNYSFLLSSNKIQSLEVERVSDLGSISLLQNLKELVLKSCYLWEDDCKSLPKLQKLTNLDLSGQLKKDGANWLQNICELSNLTELKISIQKKWDDKKQQVQVSFNCLKKLQKLQKLKINSVTQPETVRAISFLPNLIELNLSNKENAFLPNRIGDKGCHELQNMKSLRILRLENNGVGDLGASYLSILTELQQLYLSNLCSISNGISSIGAGHLAKLRNLRVLDLMRNNIGDEGAKKISKLQNLTRLGLYMNEIGIDGMAALCRCLPKLQAIQLFRNNIGNEGINQARKLTRLKRAGFSACQVDTNGIYFLEKAKLQSFDITINRVNVPVIRRMKKRLPKTEVRADDYSWEF